MNEAGFWERVMFSPGGCWLWSGRTSAFGYGRLTTASGRQPHAHRFMWELLHGALPADMYVCHRCDVKLCVRPDHLFVGTAADNARDCWAKGRMHWQTHPSSRPRGVRNGRSKLDWRAVTKIRHLLKQGIGKREIGRRFGIVHTTVIQIERGQTWVRK